MGAQPGPRGLGKHCRHLRAWELTLVPQICRCAAAAGGQTPLLMAGSSFSYLNTEGHRTPDSFNTQVSQRASEQMLQELLKEKEEKEKTIQELSKQLRRTEKRNARLQKRLGELEKAHLQETSSYHAKRQPHEVQTQATATVYVGSQTPLPMWASCSGKEQQVREGFRGKDLAGG